MSNIRPGVDKVGFFIKVDITPSTGPYFVAWFNTHSGGIYTELVPKTLVKQDNKILVEIVRQEKDYIVIRTPAGIELEVDKID